MENTSRNEKKAASPSLGQFSNQVREISDRLSEFSDLTYPEMMAHERFGIRDFPMTYKTLNKSKEEMMKERMEFKLFEEEDPKMATEQYCLKKTAQ
uniref:Uncharacterized protein n=1 Tax=Ditylenchus dipsaci TaxID=166011 RepID=A0A915DD60_9BILA